MPFLGRLTAEPRPAHIDQRIEWKALDAIEHVADLRARRRSAVAPATRRKLGVRARRAVADVPAVRVRNRRLPLVHEHAAGVDRRDVRDADHEVAPDTQSLKARTLPGSRCRARRRRRWLAQVALIGAARDSSGSASASSRRRTGTGPMSAPAVAPPMYAAVGDRLVVFAEDGRVGSEDDVRRGHQRLGRHDVRSREDARPQRLVRIARLGEDAPFAARSPGAARRRSA